MRVCDPSQLPWGGADAKSLGPGLTLAAERGHEEAVWQAYVAHSLIGTTDADVAIRRQRAPAWSAVTFARIYGHVGVAHALMRLAGFDPAEPLGRGAEDREIPEGAGQWDLKCVCGVVTEARSTRLECACTSCFMMLAWPSKCSGCEAFLTPGIKVRNC